MPCKKTSTEKCIHKKRMVCRHALAGSCENEDKCKFFEDAPEKLDKDEKWYEQ